MTKTHSHPLFFIQKKTFPLILYIQQKHPFNQNIKINNYTIPNIKNPPPKQLTPSPPQWQHIKNYHTIYQQNL